MMSVALVVNYGNDLKKVINIHPQTQKGFDAFEPMFDDRYETDAYSVGEFEVEGVTFKVFGPSRSKSE